MSRTERMTAAPLWLEYSGLPALLREKVRGGGAWTLFRKIVELDCERHSLPGTVEVTLDELAARTGLEPAALRKAALGLRKLKLVSCFLPESDEEEALFRVRVPLDAPIGPVELARLHPDLFASPAGQHFRYATAASGDDDPDAAPADDPALREIVDLYFDVVGLRMNAFVLDELRLLRSRYDLESIRRTFRRARQNGIHALNWIVRELVRQKRKDGEPRTH